MGHGLSFSTSTRADLYMTARPHPGYIKCRGARVVIRLLIILFTMHDDACSHKTCGCGRLTVEAKRAVQRTRRASLTGKRNSVDNSDMILASRSQDTNAMLSTA